MRLKRQIIFSISITFFLTATLFAQDFPKIFPSDGLEGFKKKAPIVVKGDKVEYLHAEKEINATGNVSITYGDVKLTCDRIIVHTDTKVGICEGNVKITQPGATFTGEKVEYYFEDKTGEILDGYVKADPMYAHADKIEKTSEKRLAFEDGYVTTCDRENPHYRLSAKKVIFYLDDKVIAINVFFYIGKVPVLYLPYYIQLLRDTKTKVNIIPGYDGDWGYYALGSYRFYLSELAKGYLRLDYRHKKGFGEGIDYNYNTEELGSGLARFYFAQENNRFALVDSGRIDDRYRFQYKHTIDFENDTQGIIELNKVSDTEVIKDYFYKELEEGWKPDNYVSVITNKPSYSFEFLTQKRWDDFFTTIEKLPELKLNVYNSRLWDTRFYYTNDVAFTNFHKKYAYFLNMPDENIVRFDTYNKFSYAAKLFKFLYATPYVATRQTYYSENKFGKPDILRGVYEYGLELSTKFYRIFDIEAESFDIHKLRHIITPRIGFRHRNQPTAAHNTLFQLDGIDAIDYENFISLGLESKLQTKRKSGNEWNSVDLVRFVMGTEYHYRFKKGNTSFKGIGEFSDFNYELELRPYDWLYAKTNIKTFINKWSVRDVVKSANTDVVLDLGEKFRYGMGHIYENSAGESTSQFTMEVNYKIFKGLGIRAYERFDAHDQEWEEQEYTIYKDLHCWSVELSCNIRDEDVGFWIIFRLKAFPDVPIGFKQTYHRPRPGTGL